jgi:hypothetical protein
MRRSAVLEGAVEAAELLFDVVARLAGQLEGLDHQVSGTGYGSTRGDLEAVADRVILDTP